MGELGSRRGIAYDSRRLDPEGQSFVFRAEAAGTYALRFCKQDFIRDIILNDHVQVIVGEVPEAAGAGWFNPPLDRGRVLAEPRWPAPLEEARLARPGNVAAASNAPDTPQAAGNAAVPAVPQTSSANRQPSADSTLAIPGNAVPVSPAAPAAASETVPALPADSPPEQYLQKAQEAFDAGRIASAIALLDQFRERYPPGTDEAYWLYGQCYEANSPGRDILAALDYYRRLVREYPQSGRFSEARGRIAYLERYYINIH
jgi:tetratricopeptide (TPR) repeat protein